MDRLRFKAGDFITYPFLYCLNRSHAVVLEVYDMFTYGNPFADANYKVFIVETGEIAFCNAKYTDKRSKKLA